MGFFGHDSIDEAMGRIIRNFGDITNVMDVVDDYLGFTDSEVYKKTVFIHLNSFPLRLPFIPLFCKKDFLVSYTFIWNIWRCQLGRELTPEEEKMVYGDLANRIIFLLYNFDSNLETPPTDEEFFVQMGKIVKKDKRAKKLEDAFLNLRQAIKLDTFGESPFSFGVNEIAWTHFLAGCSAVHSGRDFVSAEDIVIGNKVYIKLVNTDLDSLIRSL
ncbi:MAG: hypothetical protein CVV28_06405 [Methanobacteriales archaeon HGW-Methanobacteriales-1]|nr:MAG: hypothetical protein CVV28_06405 [Methanobacteriales archaeon HGW-Methanobacteriales-1]